MKRLALALALVAVACTSNTPSRRTTVTVFAAASLSNAFAAEGKAFEKAHPGVRVVFSFAGSQALVAQIKQGAPADVLATADRATISSVRAELAAEPVVFAHNQLAIVTAHGGAPVRALSELAKPGLKVVLAGPTVPLGKATAHALRAAGVTVKPVSYEDSASGVIAKVRLSEADAGIAYVSDLRTSGVPLDGTHLDGTRTDLAIATLNRKADAVAFVAFVRSAQGRDILQAFGFQ